MLKRLSMLRPARAVVKKHQSKQASLSTILKHRERLKPGLFVSTSARVWRHWGTPLPEHLRLSKGGRLGTLDGGLAARFGGSFRASTQSAIPPCFFLSGSHGIRHGFPLVVAASRESLIFLDPETARVHRTPGTGRRFSDEYVNLRDGYAQHIPSPRFDILDGGSLLYEEYCTGGLFRNLPIGARLSVVRYFFDRFTDLVRSKGRDSSYLQVSAAVERASNARLPASLRKVLEDTDISALAHNWPLVPSQSDFHHANLIMMNDRAVVIDFPSWGMSLQPYFVDIVGLPLQAGDDIRRAMLHGEFDDKLAQLVSATGDSPSELLAWKAGLLAARCLVVASSGTSHPANFDDSVFEREVARIWSHSWPVSSVL